MPKKKKGSRKNQASSASRGKKQKSQRDVTKKKERREEEPSTSDEEPQTRDAAAGCMQPEDDADMAVIYTPSFVEDEGAAQMEQTQHPTSSPSDTPSVVSLPPTPLPFIPDEAFFREEGLSELSEIALWKVSEVISQSHFMQLGIKLGVDLARVQQLDSEVRNDPSALTETTFRMLHGWQRNQEQGNTKLLFDVLTQQLQFSGELILQKFEDEVFRCDSDNPHSFTAMQLWNISEDIHVSQHTPMSLRLGVSYNRLSAIRKDKKHNSIDALYQTLISWREKLPLQVDQPETMAKVLEACQEKKLAYQVRREHLGISSQGKAMKFVPKDVPEVVQAAGYPRDVTISVRYPDEELQEMAQGSLRQILRDSERTLVPVEETTVLERTLVPVEETTTFEEELRSVSMWVKRHWHKLRLLEKNLGREGMYNLVGFALDSIHIRMRVYSQEGLEWLKRDIQSGLIGQRLAKFLVPDTQAQCGKNTAPQITIEEMPGQGGIFTSQPDPSVVHQTKVSGPSGIWSREQIQQTEKAADEIPPAGQSGTEILKEGASTRTEVAAVTAGTDISGTVERRDHVKPMDNWTEDEVLIWLKDEVKFPEDLVKRFDGVDGFTLARLKQRELREDFELTVGHSKKLMYRREDYLQRVGKEEVRKEKCLSPSGDIEQESKISSEVEHNSGQAEELPTSTSSSEVSEVQELGQSSQNFQGAILSKKDEEENDEHILKTVESTTVAKENEKGNNDDSIPLQVEGTQTREIPQTVTESVNLMAFSDSEDCKEDQQESGSCEKPERSEHQVLPSAENQTFVSTVKVDVTQSSHEATSTTRETQNIPFVKRNVATSSETERKLTNLLLGMDKGKLDSSYYPVLVANTPHEDFSTKEEIKEKFGFMSSVSWNAVFDCNPNSNIGGLCQYVNGEKPIKILSAETFTETKDVDDLRAGIEFPEVPVWVFPNGRNDVEEKREETLSDQDWVRDRSNDVLSTVRFFSDPSVIPAGRAVVIFLLLSDADFMVMTHIFREFYSSKSFKNLKYFTVIAEDHDVMQKWIRNVESIVSRKNMSERCLEGVSWEEINQYMMHLLGSCETQLPKLPLSPKGSCDLHKKHQSQWSDIAVLAKNECENTSMGESNPNFEDFVRDKELNFYKGREVDWWNFYLSGTNMNKGKGFNHVLQRDVLSKLHTEVRRILGSRGKKTKHINMVTVFHEAGSGGTTLAKNILWEFRQDYRCATVKRITNDTVKQIMAFKQYGYNQSGNSGAVIILLENQDLESMRLFLANLEQETRYIRDDGVAFVLIHSKRTNEAEKLASLQENKPCIAVQHELSEKERAWFQEKTKDLEQEGVFSEKDSPETLLAFMVMKHECDLTYVKNLVQGILPKINKSSEEVQNAVSILKYIAAIHQYNPDFAMPVSACDGFMQTEEHMCTSGHRQSHPLWEKNKPRFLDLLLKEELIQDIEGCVPGLGIVHHSVAQEILAQLGMIYSQTPADMILELMEKSPILDTMAYSRGYIQKVCRDLLVRRLKREYGDDQETNFAPFIEDVYQEDKTKAFKIMELGFKKFKDALIAQQQARLFSKYEGDYEKAENAIDAGIGFLSNSYLLDTKGNILRKKMSQYKDGPGPITDSDMTDLLQIVQDACAAFQRAQELMKEETTGQNYASFLNEILTVFEFLEIVAKRVTPFSWRAQGLERLQQYLITNYVPSELKLEAVLRHEEFMKGLQDRVETALSRFMDHRIQCARQRFGSARSHFFEKKIENVFQQRNYFFALSHLPHGKQYPTDTIYTIRRSQVKKMNADGYHQIFDLASKNKVGELSESKSLLKKNLGSGNLFDVKNYIFISFALSICSDESLDETEMRSLLPTLKRKEEPGGFYGLFFEMLLSWPDGNPKNEVRPISSIIRELRQRWNDRYENPHHGVEQRMTKGSRILRYDVKKPTTEFYLGHPQRKSKFVHRNEMGFITYSVWKEEGVREKLARLEGTLDSKHYVLYKPKRDEPMKIRLSLPLTGLPSQEPVEFYLGFSFAGPLAYDVTYKDNRETPFLARETLYKYPSYINDIDEDSLSVIDFD